MRRALLLLAFILLLGSMWIALTLGQITPVKRNILYAHVPSSICALLCFVVLLIASIGYLKTNRQIWDIVAVASAEVGAVFATILNATGMIFSRAEWNIWWTPSPRLVSSAILWFLYVAYLIMRSSLPVSQHKKARVCAVLGIIAFLDVPMVIISARFIPDIHRANFTFDSPWQSAGLMLSMAAMVFIAANMIWLKTDILKNKTRFEKESIS
ncbi:MAG: cytochrome c biogenesis protein CcsA [Phycisphaerae bacterium]|nr:cytochrome c biogenesis protein CcsA [Phycisphaerae bacterium]